MYSAFRQLCERTLRIPPEPEPPPGDETQTRIFRAAPNYYRYLLAIWAIKTAALFLGIVLFVGVPLVATLASTRSDGVVPLIIILGLLLPLVLFSRLVALAIVALDYEKRWYLVTDRSLRVREGILQVREATVTFANIQNISVSQGPVQRVLGISDLRVDTAGGGSAVHGEYTTHNLHTTWFRGVDNAGQIRELMQERLRHLKDFGLGDHEELVELSQPELSSDVVAALREVGEEARQLREAAGRRVKIV